jgi:hypothetical protein
MHDIAEHAGETLELAVALRSRVGEEALHDGREIGVAIFHGSDGEKRWIFKALVRSARAVAHPALGEDPSRVGLRR